MKKISCPRIAILGGGIAGLSVAYRFCQRKIPCDLFLGKPTTHQCSRLAQGVATLKGYHLASHHLFQAKRLGHEELLTMMEAIHFTDYAFHVRELFASQQAYYQQVTRTYHQQFRGFSSMSSSLLNNQSSVELYPVAHDYPDDYVFSAHSLLDHLKQTLEQSGLVRVYSTNFSVADYRKSHHYRHLILALGAHTQDWLATLGFASTKYRLTPGAVFTIDDQRLDSELQTWLSVVAPSWKPSSSSLLGFKKGSSSLRFTSTHKKKGHCAYQLALGSVQKRVPEASVPSILLSLQDPSVERETRRALIPFARSFGLLLSESIKSSIQIQWGVRYRGLSLKPIIGELRVPANHLSVGSQAPRLWLFCGFHKSGFSLAPYLSKDFVEDILSAKSTANGSRIIVDPHQQFHWQG